MTRNIRTISPETTMLAAAKTMKELNIRHLPIIQENKLIGILSDRDIKRAETVVNNGGKCEAHIYPHKLVSEYMSPTIHRINEDTEISEVVREILDLKVSCLIVEDNKHQHVGIVTTDDLLLLLLEVLKGQKSFLNNIKKVFGQI